MQLQERLAGIHRELDGLAAQAAREREERLRGLQLAARSLRQAESTAQWVQILADAAAPLAESVCFFRVDGEKLRCEAARGMEAVCQEVALADAPAFRQAVDSRETVVCLFAASQLSAAVAGETASRGRAHLFPLVGKSRVLGVLLAMDERGPDTYGLEVLLSLGAAALELRETKSATLIGVAAPARSAPAPTTARQFARATVAQWVLEQGRAIASGRGSGDLYGALRGSIDEARRVFGSRYLPGPDYLHAEILGRLACGNERLMGPMYPGPLNGGASA